MFHFIYLFMLKSWIDIQRQQPSHFSVVSKILQISDRSEDQKELYCQVHLHILGFVQVTEASSTQRTTTTQIIKNNYSICE